MRTAPQVPVDMEGHLSYNLTVLERQKGLLRRALRFVENELDTEIEVSRIMADCIGVLESESLMDFVVSDDKLLRTAATTSFCADHTMLEVHFDKAVELIMKTGLYSTGSELYSAGPESGNPSQDAIDKEQLECTLSKLLIIPQLRPHVPGTEEFESDEEIEIDSDVLEALLGRHRIRKTLE